MLLSKLTYKTFRVYILSVLMISAKYYVALCTFCDTYSEIPLSGVKSAVIYYVVISETDGCEPGNI